VDTSGRALLGDPNQGLKKDAKKPAKAGETAGVLGAVLPKLEGLTKLNDNLSEYSFPVRQVGGIVGALFFGWLILSFMNAAPESVVGPSRKAVEALASDNLDRLKSYAADDTLSDVIRWYDVTHAKLEKARKGWPSKDATVQVVVVEEDHRKQKGVVEAFLMPTVPTTQTASVIPSGDPKSSSKNNVPSGPVGFQLHWIYDGSHWRLDGRQTFAVATQ